MGTGRSIAWCWAAPPVVGHGVRVTLATKAYHEHQSPRGRRKLGNEEATATVTQSTETLGVSRALYMQKCWECYLGQIETLGSAINPGLITTPVHGSQILTLGHAELK